jgi:signal transduction histidine kinase
MTLGARLTLWQTFLLAFLLTAFAVISYRALDTGLRAELDRVLVERADHAALAVQAIPNLSIVGVSPSLSTGFASPGIYVQIVDEAGRVALRSTSLGADSLPVHADRLAEVLNGRSFYETESVADQNVRLYHRPIIRDGRVIGAVEVGGSLYGVEDTLSRLRAIFALIIAASLIVGALGSYCLTHIGLLPLARLAAVTARIGHARDLSARIVHHGPLDEMGRLAVTFNEMLSRLETVFNTQQFFLAEAAHELRTPLASLLGNADLLARYGDDLDRRAAALTAIRAEGHRTSRLLNDLLLSVQADTGWQLQLRPVQLADVLRSVVASVRPFVNDAALALAEPPPVVVLGDADRLKQVFLNLVDNALKHTLSGAAIRIRLTIAGSWVVVVVADNGEGISADALPHIFDRFYRAHGNGRGSGLGLSIARWIVEQHSGRIEVESEVGRGSEFSVWLPVQTPSS